MGGQRGDNGNINKKDEVTTGDTGKRQRERQRKGKSQRNGLDYPEIRDLDAATVIQQQVAGLKVSMHLLVGVHPGDAVKDLLSHDAQNGLRDASGKLEDIGHAPRSHVLQGNRDRPLIVEGAVEPNERVVSSVAHHHNFLHHLLIHAHAHALTRVIISTNSVMYTLLGSFRVHPPWIISTQRRVHPPWILKNKKEGVREWSTCAVDRKRERERKRENESVCV